MREIRVSLRALRYHADRLAAVERERDALRQLVADLVDPDPCSLDHHGYCQAHSLDLDCPHARAKALLAETKLPTPGATP